MNNLGIAGGQNHKSLYFVGIANAHACKDPKLFFLDPHFVQEACSPAGAFDRASYYSKEIRTLPLSKLCTSVCIGFYLRDLDAFKVFEK